LKLVEGGEIPRDPAAQKAVSYKTGDHAGHRIPARFGGDTGEQNLARQNSKINLGTHKRMENGWARDCRSGSDVKVDASADIYRPGEHRPYTRIVRWTVQRPDGTQTKHELRFANTHTAASRAAAGDSETPVRTTEQKDNLIQASHRFRNDAD
jgi:hypothetical protein